MSDGTGWTIIQSRGMRGVQRQSFAMNFTSYEKGFGTTCADHWIGAYLLLITVCLKIDVYFYLNIFDRTGSDKCLDRKHGPGNIYNSQRIKNNYICRHVVIELWVRVPIFQSWE